MEQVISGAENLVSNYIKPGPDDGVVIAYVPKARDKAAVLGMVLEGRVRTAAFGFSPYHDPHFNTRLQAAIAEAAGAHLHIITLEDDSLSHSSILERQYTSQRAPVSIYRLISTDDHTFANAFNVRPESITARNSGLLHALMGDHSVAITSPNGTSLEFSLSSKYEWLSVRGTTRPGAFVILPAGEVATYTPDITGTFVADLAMRVNVANRLDASLIDTPITMELEHSRIMNFQTARADLTEFIENCLLRDNTDRVGEIGFGTNYGVSEPSKVNSHTNERIPGLHLGFGTANQSEELVPYDAAIHLDLVGRGGTVNIDGQHELELARPSFELNLSHPALPRDQDVSGDCCSRGCLLGQPGILTV